MNSTAEKRESGISLVGNLPWGSHFCQFYSTRKDMLDILVPYFRAGIENNEFCVWVTSDFLTEEDAFAAMTAGIPDFARYRAERRIEVFPYTDWYLKGGNFDLRRTLNMWMEKHDEALSRGFSGMRGERQSLLDRQQKGLGRFCVLRGGDQQRHRRNEAAGVMHLFP